jgi:hypothetical protein
VEKMINRGLWLGPTSVQEHDLHSLKWTTSLLISRKGLPLPSRPLFHPPFSHRPWLPYIIKYPFRPVSTLSRSKKYQYRTVFVLVINARCCATNAIKELGAT